MKASLKKWLVKENIFLFLITCEQRLVIVSRALYEDLMAMAAHAWPRTREKTH